MFNKGAFDCIFTEAAASPGKQQNLNSPEETENSFLLKAKTCTSNGSNLELKTASISVVHTMRNRNSVFQTVHLKVKTRYEDIWSILY